MAKVDPQMPPQHRRAPCWQRYFFLFESHLYTPDSWGVSFCWLPSSWPSLLVSSPLLLLLPLVFLSASFWLSSFWILRSPASPPCWRQEHCPARHVCLGRAGRVLMRLSTPLVCVVASPGTRSWESGIRKPPAAVFRSPLFLLLFSLSIRIASLLRSVFPLRTVRRKSLGSLRIL